MAYELLQYSLAALTIMFFILGIIFHISASKLKRKQSTAIVSILGMKEMIKKKKV